VRITISGTPGSGKSTLARRLARVLRCPYVNAGQIFRDAARRRGMTLARFAAYVEAHPALDRKLDAALVTRAKQYRNLILEGRLTGWMTKRARLPAFRIWVTARERTRVDRLMQRDGGVRLATLRKLRERARGEARRYRKFYGIDMRSLAPYDLIIKTDERTPEETAKTVLAAIRSRSGGL
jgi:predicted cytidylate kinase